MEYPSALTVLHRYNMVGLPRKKHESAATRPQAMPLLARDSPSARTARNLRPRTAANWGERPRLRGRAGRDATEGPDHSDSQRGGPSARSIVFAVWPLAWSGGHGGARARQAVAAGALRSRQGAQAAAEEKRTPSPLGGSLGMCGIVAYTGQRQAAAILLQALARLEYRGYDSAGIAVETGGRITTRKLAGRVTALG